MNSCTNVSTGQMVDLEDRSRNLYESIRRSENGHSAIRCNELAQQIRGAYSLRNSPDLDEEAKERIEEVKNELMVVYQNDCVMFAEDELEEEIDSSN